MICKTVFWPKHPRHVAQPASGSLCRLYCSETIQIGLWLNTERSSVHWLEHPFALSFAPPVLPGAPNFFNFLYTFFVGIFCLVTWHTRSVCFPFFFQQRVDITKRFSEAFSCEPKMAWWHAPSIRVHGTLGLQKRCWLVIIKPDRWSRLNLGVVFPWS